MAAVGMAAAGTAPEGIVRRELPSNDPAPFHGAATSPIRLLQHDPRVLEAAFSAAKLGVWECTLPDERLQWSDAVRDIFEVPRGIALSRDAIVSCYAPEASSELGRLRSEAIARGVGFEFDAEIVTLRGTRKWIRITASVEVVDGTPVRIFGIKRDITEERRLFERLRYLAECDTLTGLANRASFNAALADLRAAARHGTGDVALLLMDLDGFKSINDTHGHHCGDDVLQVTARRLERACPKARLVARIGGDEFAVLIEADRAAAATIAARIVAAVAEPIDDGEATYRVGASIGIAFLGASGPDRFVRDADAALYAAKAAGRNTFRMFDAEHLRSLAAAAGARGVDASEFGTPGLGTPGLGTPGLGTPESGPALRKLRS
ncbi:diguanylate cyclase domain-containing protein [Methyloraptor flagellatus]|uniref:Diguanylate cyclase n=1 Tax=Methyloraptor flagellatus TaxID=3162530 RepID=A0AAU7X7W7_9HYPH